MKFLPYALAGVGGLAYLSHLKKEADKLLWEARGSIFSVNTEGVKIKLDVILKNPTLTDFTFSFPFITIGLDETDVLASSQVSSTKVELPGGSQKPLDPIWITLPLSSVLRLGLAAFNAIKDGKQGLKLVAKAMTNADLLFGLVSHEIPPLRQDLTIIKEKSG